MVTDHQNFFSTLEAKLNSHHSLFAEMMEDNSEAIMREMSSTNALSEKGRSTYVIETKPTSICLTETDMLFDAETNESVYIFQVNVNSISHIQVENFEPTYDMDREDSYGEVFKSEVTFFKKFIISLSKEPAFESLLKTAFNHTLRFEEYDFFVSTPSYLRPLTKSEYSYEIEYEDKVDPFADFAVSLHSDGVNSDEKINKLVNYNDDYDFFDEEKEDW